MLFESFESNPIWTEQNICISNQVEGWPVFLQNNVACGPVLQAEISSYSDLSAGYYSGCISICGYLIDIPGAQPDNPFLI